MVVTSPPYFNLRDYGIDGQIGRESTPSEYVEQIVAVFREVRRVLKEDGVVFLNLGDSYGPRKQLLGVPWRVAFSLQSDGWTLRSDIIWHKPAVMPESVDDRPTKAHEYMFLLTKAQRYYYDASAIQESGSGITGGRQRAALDGSYKYRNSTFKDTADVGQGRRNGGIYQSPYTGTRNKRSVWTVATMPYSGAHFATMPEALVEPCILAGSRLGDLVYDPFIGSGTVGAVASRLGRRWVGTDLNPAYHKLAKKRTAQRGLAFEAIA
jgi:DNA modification methylase